MTKRLSEFKTLDELAHKLELVAGCLAPSQDYPSKEIILEFFRRAIEIGSTKNQEKI